MSHDNKFSRQGISVVKIANNGNKLTDERERIVMRFFKKQLLYALVICLLFGCSTQMIDVSMGETQQSKAECGNAALLWTAFTATGAQPVGIEVNGWAMKQQTIAPAEAKALLTKLAKTLQINNYRLEENKEEYTGYFSIKQSAYLAQDAWIEIGVQNLNFADQDVAKPESYILVNFAEQHPDEAACQWETRIAAALQSLGYQPNITTCYSGIIDGKINRRQMNELSETVMTKLDASKVEGVTEASFASIAAYTPRLQNQITVGAKKVNLNLAFRYDSLNKQTHVVMATPLITTEY